MRFDFENDAVLIELGENDRDLALAEGVVERVVDRLGEDVEARGFLAIDIDVELQAVDLLIARDVGQLRKLPEFLHQLRRPLRQFRCVGILQGVLVLRAADAGVDLHILRGLHEERNAFDVARCLAQAVDDFLRARASFVVRLEDDEEPRGVDRGVDRAGADEAETLATSGSCRTISEMAWTRAIMAVKEISSAASVTPMITPVSCCGSSPFGIMM